VETAGEPPRQRASERRSCESTRLRLSSPLRRPIKFRRPRPRRARAHGKAQGRRARMASRMRWVRNHALLSRADNNLDGLTSTQRRHRRQTAMRTMIVTMRNLLESAPDLDEEVHDERPRETKFGGQDLKSNGLGRRAQAPSRVFDFLCRWTCTNRMPIQLISCNARRWIDVRRARRILVPTATMRSERPALLPVQEFC